MGKRRVTFFAIIAAVCLALTLGLTACGEQKASISLDKTTLTIERFDTATITATVEGTTDTVVWSSDDETVATVSDGTVTALKAGTVTITATAGSVSATCAVTVTDSGYFPVLSLGRSSLTLVEEATFTLTPSVTFRGNGVSAAFTYESSDPTVATVSDEGVITAIKDGETTVTVRSSYVGQDLEEIVTVTVLENSSVTLSDSSVTLATSVPDGTSYLNSKTITADVINKGAAGDASAIVWTSESESVATVEGGVITAKGEGATTVTASFVTSSGKTVSASVAVEVVIPVVKYDGSFDWDLSVSPIVKLDVNAVAGKTADKVVRVEVDGAVANTEADTDENKIKIKGLTSGEKSVVVYFADLAYEVDVVAASKIITTKDELVNLKSYLTETTTATNKLRYDGYVILGADVDMAGANFNKLCGLVDKVGDYGFMGVFDGRGHVIKNASVNGEQYLFGVMGTEGVIRNVGFVDVTFSGRNASLLGIRVFGLIEDVFVKATANGRYNWTGALTSLGHGEYKNVFVYIEDSGAPSGDVGSVVGKADSAVTLTNVFSVSSYSNVGTPYSGSTITNCGKSLTLTAFKESEYDLSGFNTEYWTVDDGLPLFKSYAAMLSDFAITSDKPELYAKDEVTFAANHEAIFSAQTPIDGVTVTPDGVVTVSADFEGEATLVLVATSQFDSTRTDTKTISIKAVRRQDLTTVYNIDLSGSELSIPLTGITGTVTKVTDRNGDAVTATIGSDKITFTKESLTAVGFGKQTLSLVTDDVIYDATNVVIISKVISTKADMLALATYATKEADMVWNGYFLIDSDIDMEGSSFNAIQPWANGIKSDGSHGFKGTIDGQGHIISNVSIAGGGTNKTNLVGHLATGGVVKNIGFVNVKLTDVNPAVVAFRSNGTIENIFVVGERTADSATAYSGALVALNHTGIKNCAVYLYDNNSISDTQRIGAFAGKAEVKFTLTNCWAVGQARVVGLAKGESANDFFTRVNSYGQRANIQILRDYIATPKNKQDLTKLDMDYWDISLGVPVFKSYLSYINNIAAVNAPATVNGGGETVTLEANGRALFEIVEGGDVASIKYLSYSSANPYVGYYAKLTTAETVAEDTVITVRVKSEFDTSKYSDIQITVKKTLPKENLDGTYTADVTSALEIPTTAIEGAITEVKSGNDSLTFDSADGKITLASSEVAKIGVGEKTISVLTDVKEYVVSVDIYSKIITTKDEFLNMKSYLTASTEFPGTRYDGRIALGANIDLEGAKFTTMEAHASSGGSWETYGFRGTFDGKGYTVSNYGGCVGNAGTNGLFGIVGADAVIKNVAFVNATIDSGNSGLFAMRFHGTLENVYVQGTRTNGGNWTGAIAGLNHGTMINCVVNVDDSTANGTNDGALFGNAESVRDGRPAITITNCFAISSKTALIGNLNGQTVTVTNSGVAADAEAFKSLGLDLSVLSSDYWDTTGDFPTFKTK